MSNRSNGVGFERDLSGLLMERGFWVHQMTQNAGGQPADLIAVRGRYHALIDCKVVSAGRTFRFSRVEPNQYTAMAVFESRGHEPGWFAIRWPGGEITMLSSDILMDLERVGNASIHYDDRFSYGMSLDDWTERAYHEG